MIQDHANSQRRLTFIDWHLPPTRIGKPLRPPIDVGPSAFRLEARRARPRG